MSGSLYAAVAFLFMALFGVITKIVASHESAIWTSFVTYLFCTLFLLPQAYKIGIKRQSAELLNLYVGRTLFGLGASYLYMISISSIPLANATLLYSTAPLFIPFIAMGWFKNKISFATWMAIGTGFVGIWLIIRPASLDVDHIGCLIGLAAGLSLAFAFTFLKRLVAEENASLVIFYFSLLATLFQLPLALSFWQPPSISSTFLLSIAALSFVLVQLFICRAYKYASVSQIGVFQYLTIPYVTIIDWWFWGVRPTTCDVIGMLVVVSAGSFILLRKEN